MLALIADTHGFRDGLPPFFAFLTRCGVKKLACLGDCDPEPFRAWLEFNPAHELYWIYDVQGPEMPEATATGPALKLGEWIFLAHTRATAVLSHHQEIQAYKNRPPSGRPPLVICHGHTHTPSVTRFGPRVNQILYINSCVRPYLLRPRRQLVALEQDAVYLVVPGSFTLEDGRHPSFNFTLLDPARQLVEMFTLTDLGEFATLASLLTGTDRT